MKGPCSLRVLIQLMNCIVLQNLFSKQVIRILVARLEERDGIEIITMIAILLQEYNKNLKDVVRYKTLIPLCEGGSDRKIYRMLNMYVTIHGKSIYVPSNCIHVIW